LSHQWYYSANTVLADATNATLTLTNLQTTNAVQAAAGGRERRLHHHLHRHQWADHHPGQR
jgi:hypothetical protein